MKWNELGRHILEKADFRQKKKQVKLYHFDLLQSEQRESSIALVSQ